MSSPLAKPRFQCPRCGQKLSFLDGTLIKMVCRLHAESFSCKTMVYIPAKLGQYGAIVGEGVRLREGANLELECVNGACKANFTTAHDPTLAEITMIDTDGHEYEVYFNKVYGQRSTFLVDRRNKSLVESYGEHAAEYVRGFDKPLNFMGK